MEKINNMPTNTIEKKEEKTPNLLEVSRRKIKKSFEQEKEQSLSVLENELLERRNFDLSSLSSKEQFELLKSRSLQIIPEEKLLEKLDKSKREKKPLTVKFGIDPTGSEIHIGHAVPMIIVNRLQRMGHKVIFVIGDFTAKIGDPSGRIDSRPILTDEMIVKNLSTYKEQIRPFFDLSNAEVVHNGDWLNKITLPDFVKLLSKINISESLQREDFRNRLSKGEGLTQAELLYSVIMALDSLHLKNDIELGGVDQLLNLQMCRRVMEIGGEEPECVITTDLLPGISGDNKKMSKSYDNYIGLTHSPEEIYGRIMSIPDLLIETYFKAMTEIDDEEWNVLKNVMSNGDLNPMELKKVLARYMVTILHNSEDAKFAENEFVKKFSKKKYDQMENIIEYSVNGNELLINFLADNKILKSRSEVKRLADDGGIKIINANNIIVKIDDPFKSFYQLTNEKKFYLKIGRKVFSIDLV